MQNTNLQVNSQFEFVNCRLQFIKCKLQITIYKLKTTIYKLQTTIYNCKLQFINYKLKNTILHFMIREWTSGHIKGVLSELIIFSKLTNFLLP